MRQVVVLHGWSDSSDSFKPLIAFLKQHGFDVVPLFLGDYVSLRDDVRIEDVGRRMHEVVRERMAKPANARDHLEAPFDLIVHSTGGLLARWWICEYFRDARCPVQNLLMLAPANFGSVLAHKGLSMLGRLFKGAKTGFEVGEEMLRGLELGSSLQWDLALRDLLVMDGVSDSTSFYGPDKIRPFVIVGTHPYPEPTRKLINENGSDGTVRVAAANLNTLGITVDFTVSLDEPEIRPWRRRGGVNLEFPLAVLPDRDHGDVIDPAAQGLSDSAAYAAQLGELILSALGTNTKAEYASRVDEWNAVSMDTRTYAGASEDAVQHRRSIFGKHPPPPDYFHEHFQLVVCAEDQFGEPIPDFFVEFFPKPKLLHRFSEFNRAAAFFHGEVLEHVHRNERDPSRVVFFVDRFDLMREGGFYSMIAKNHAAALAMTVTADDPGPNVSYFGAHGIPSRRGIVDLHGKLKADRWLKRHTTHFVRVIIPRVGGDHLFKLKRA
jgi:pimeloyl-ACP methyl ester carboxylesterase